jgi:hypothetical protein
VTAKEIMAQYQTRPTWPTEGQFETREDYQRFMQQWFGFAMIDLKPDHDQS